MVDYKPGDVVYTEFTTQVFSTGVATNADSLPTGIVNRNGTDDGAVTVTVTNLDTGRYKAVFTIPVTYLPGDVLNLSIAATVSSVAGKAAIWHRKLGFGFIRAGTAQAGTAGTITLDASASATNNFYQYMEIYIVAGTGAGQVGQCIGYVGSTQVAIMSADWLVNPDNTSIFVVLPMRTDWAKVSDLASLSTISNQILRSDNLVELTTVPPATPTLEQAIMWLFMKLRNTNTMDTSSNFDKIRNDAGTVIAKKAITDDGTTFTSTKAVAGP